MPQDDKTPHEAKPALFDRIIKKAKDNYFVAIVLLIGTALIAFSQMQDAIMNIGRLSIFGRHALEIVDVRILDDEVTINEAMGEIRSKSPNGGQIEGDFPIGDILVRNTGDDPSVISAINYTAEIETYESIPWFNFLCRPIFASQSYNVLLNANEVHQTGSVPIAQAIPPKGTDRFAIIVGQAGAKIVNKVSGVDEYR